MSTETRGRYAIQKSIKPRWEMWARVTEHPIVATGSSVTNALIDRFTVRFTLLYGRRLAIAMPQTRNRNEKR